MVESFSPNGHVMEMLSEYIVEDRLEDYLLSGRHCSMSWYEPFVQVNDSVFDRHAKLFKNHTKIPWWAPISSLNLSIALLLNVQIVGRSFERSLESTDLM